MIDPKRLFFLVLLMSVVIGIVGIGRVQILKKGDFHLGGKQTSGPISNAISDIAVVENNVWIGTKGLSRTSDNGETWTTYTRDDSLGKGGISAFTQRNGVMWVATAFDTQTADAGNLPAGGGLSYSIDDGETWHWVRQPVDSKDETEYKPTTTHIQNLTYDIALTDSAVWIASFGGGLRKSEDMGKTWQVVTVDGFPFHALEYLTHRAFSIIFDEEALWAGTAGGIHKSTDGGKTWTTFNHQNQSEGISGNFVVAIACQKTDGKNIIWAATIEATDEIEYRAVSKTEDRGLTWSVTLEGEFAHNFAFEDSVVYVTTDNGLFKSLDFGETWAVFPQIIDAETGERVYATEVYSVGVGQEHTLWVGSADGLAMTQDNGITWKIFRAFQVPGEAGTPKTYAYPNPFSPLRHNLIGGDGHVRFQYKTNRATEITVKVYDFGMNLVKTVVEEKYRSVPGDYSEVWDGRNDIGDMVANGVYFYKITLSGEESLWGKVMVVN